MQLNIIHNENCLTGLAKLPDESVNCVVTSPPYWGLRDYGIEGQLGLEKTPEEYVKKMTEIFSEVKRVLKPEGTVWLNLGDSYIGGGRGGDTKEFKYDGREKVKYHKIKKQSYLKDKDLAGIPWRAAFALQREGWYLRQDIIWSKPNPMPESVTDRCTKSHEYIFLLSKSKKYYFDYEAIQEEATGYDGRKDIMMKGSEKYNQPVVPRQDVHHIMASQEHVRWKKRKASGTNYGTDGKGFKNHSGYDILENPYVRNKRSVWTVNNKPFSEAHFAVFPEKLIVDCIKAGCPVNGVVLDPFMGAGTTAIVAKKLERNYLGFELNGDYIKIIEKRIYQEFGMFI